jgi:hypothetical protein
MNQYIAQLIDDMRAAAAAAPPDPLEDENLPSWQAADIQIEASEQFVNGVPEPLSKIVGVPSNLLPDPHRLSNQQISRLVSEMLILLEAYNFIPDYPQKLPDRLLYDALRNIWDEGNVHVVTGHVHIEFCNHDEDEYCPFPGHCNECQELLMIEGNDEADADDMFNTVEPSDESWRTQFDETSVLEGIQNYCDRWCERCPFRRMCYVAITEEKMDGLLEKYPDGNIPAEEMEKWPFNEDQGDGLFDDDEIHDVDFDAEWTDDEINFEPEDDDFFSPRSKAKRHPLMEQTGVFSIHMDLWLKKRYEELSDNLAPHFARGYSDEVAQAEEVLRQFHFFILIKLQRAMISFYDDELFDDGGHDMNGTAKVALLTIDETLDALTLLIRTLKNHRTELKNVRQQLEEIRNMAETEFPEARAFIRPYHDQ